MGPFSAPTNYCEDFTAISMPRSEVVSLDVEHTQEANENVEVQENNLTKLKNFVLRQFLPIGTIFSIILGIFVPRPAVYLSERIPLVKVCIMVVFFSVGLRLRFHEAKSALKSYKEVLVGLLLVLFVGPIFGTNVLNQVKQFGPLIGNASQPILKNVSNSSVKENELPIFGPEDFRLALQIICMCPCAAAPTLIVVTAANGHRGLSIMVSILCLILSVFTIPPMLLWLIPALERININIGKLMLNAVLRILLPLVIGRILRCLSPVKKVVKKWDSTIKYTAISFLIAVFLVKVSETSASGNLGRVSIVNILCIVGLGTSLTTFNLIASYGFLSILPWFSEKSTVTLSILSSNRVVTIAATIIDVLPDKAGDKGLMTLPVIFVYLSTLLMLNCFAPFAKVKEDDVNNTKDKPLSVKLKVKTSNAKGSNINSKINEVAVFTIYTDEICIKDKKLELKRSLGNVVAVLQIPR